MATIPNCVKQLVDDLIASNYLSTAVMLSPGPHMPLTVVGGAGILSSENQAVEWRFLSKAVKISSPTLLNDAPPLSPRCWKDAVTYGPLILIPLDYSNVDNLVSTSEKRFGLVVVFSTEARALAFNDLTFVVQISARHNESLFLHATLLELKWYRQAHRSFCASTTRVLNHPIWRIDANEPQAIQNPDQKPSSETSDDESPYSPDSVRKVIADQLMPVLKKGMRLNRCAILTPMGDAPEFWYYLANEGFPGNLMEEKDFYVRGQGLTGATLALKRGAPPIISDDVERDLRWSKRGKQLHRVLGEEGPMAFVGIPIFSHFSPDGDGAYAALICCRFRSPEQIPPRFTLRELRHLEIIAAQLSYGFDIVRWRQSSEERQQRQLMLSRIWTTALTEQQKLTHALDLLRMEGPFRRILLSLVTPDRKQIVGKAASGFRSSLVTDTDRRIYESPPLNPREEDILSVIVRENIKFPFPVDPNDVNDRFAAHIDRYTAGRHGVTNRLLFIPLIDNHTQVTGVILAEFPEGAQGLTREQCDRFAIYAQQLSILLQHHSLELATRGERDLFERLLSCVNERQIEGAESTDAFLREAIQGLCDLYGFATGLAYLYDDDSRLLRGRTGVGLNEIAIKATAYSVALRAHTVFEDGSFAAHVYRVRTTVFLERLDAPPVDSVNRAGCGVAADDSGMGIPLVLGDHCYGVLVLCGKSVKNPLIRSFNEIREYGRLIALAIGLAQAQARLKELEHLHELQDVCIRHVGKLSRDAVGEIQVLKIAKDGREALQDFSTEAAQLLRARLCGIFLPESQIHIPMPLVNSSKERGWPSGIPFTLRAAHGYPTELVNTPLCSYSDRTRGLTSTVIRTLATQSSDNVEKDKRWSGKLRDRTTDLFTNEAGLRAWLGTPIMINDIDGRHIYGVLTFTRTREHAKDAAFFDEADRVVAERLAWLLAVGFHTRQSVGRMYDAMKGRLRSFLHAVRLPLDLVQRDRLGRIRAISRKNGNLEELNALCDKLEMDLRFINCGFSAFTDFTRDDAEWSEFTPIVDIQEVVDTVFHIARTLSSQVRVHQPQLTLDGQSCRIDAARLTFILHALVENAIKAGRQAGGGDVWTTIRLTNKVLEVVVEDNGCGIKSDVELRIFDEGFSGFERKSSGIGLSLVKRFVDANTGGSIFHENNASGGTKFTVLLNVL